MDILAYFAAILIGISLGLIGSGGSILTVPVLVYLMAIDPVNATAYSLFIVGTTSLVGAYFYFRKGLINFKAATVFAVPALISVFLTRYYLVPAIPKELFYVGDFLVTKQIFIMLFFAILMLLAAISMIKSTTEEELESDVSFNYPMIVVEGAIVGV